MRETRLPASAYKQVVAVAADKDARRGILAVDDDGEALIDTTVASKSRSDLLGTDALTIRRSNGRTVRVPTQDRSRHFQVIGASLTSRWVVWQESRSDALNASPWVMYAFDRKDASVRQLARAADLADGETPPPVPGYTAPVIAGDRAYWIAVSGTAADLHPNLYTCTLISCVPRIVAKDAAFVSTDGESAFALRYDTATRKELRTFRVLESRGGTASIVAAVKVPQAGSAITGFATNSHDFAITTRGGRTRLWLIARGSERIRRVVVGDKGELFGYPVLTNRYVAWAESSGDSPRNFGGYMLLDGRIALVGNTSGLYGLSGAGHYLSWQDSQKVGEQKGRTVERLVVIKK